MTCLVGFLRPNDLPQAWIMLEFKSFGLFGHLYATLLYFYTFESCTCDLFIKQGCPILDGPSSCKSIHIQLFSQTTGHISDHKWHFLATHAMFAHMFNIRPHVECLATCAMFGHVYHVWRLVTCLTTCACPTICTMVTCIMSSHMCHVSHSVGLRLAQFCHPSINLSAHSCHDRVFVGLVSRLCCIHMTYFYFF